MKFEEVRIFILNRLETELPVHLTYHSIGHVKDVYAASERIAKSEHIAGEALILLLTAVLFHDSGFVIGAQDHEERSCQIALDVLPLYGYNNEQITAVCGMIMATKIPQDPHNLLEEIICDADLDYLGRDDFFTIGNTLFEELKQAGVVKTEQDWDAIQVKFLSQHQYFTQTSIATRKERKNEYLIQLKTKLTTTP